jgi:hypothetical protein
VFRPLSSSIFSLTSNLKKLRPAGAGYGFGQDSMNFVQKATGLHTSGKQLSVVAVQAGTLYEGADFKIELIVYFLGHWFHFRYYDPWQYPSSMFEPCRGYEKFQRSGFIP